MIIDSYQTLVRSRTKKYKRITPATVLVAEQVDMKTIQELMGHSDIRTTMNLYASATPAGRQNAVNALQKHTDPGNENEEIVATSR